MSVLLGRHHDPCLLVRQVKQFGKLDAAFPWHHQPFCGDASFQSANHPQADENLRATATISAARRRSDTPLVHPVA